MAQGETSVCVQSNHTVATSSYCCSLLFPVQCPEAPPSNRVFDQPVWGEHQSLHRIQVLELRLAGQIGLRLRRASLVHEQRWGTLEKLSGMGCRRTGLPGGQATMKRPGGGGFVVVAVAAAVAVVLLLLLLLCC